MSTRTPKFKTPGRRRLLSKPGFNFEIIHKDGRKAAVEGVPKSYNPYTYCKLPYTENRCCSCRQYTQLKPHQEQSNLRQERENLAHEKWNNDPLTECGGGIHFYLTRIEAEIHN